MASSKAVMCCGKKRWLIARRASIFSASSLTVSAIPKAIAERYCSVNELSLGPIVGLHLVTADRHTSGCAAIASSLSPSGEQWKYQMSSLVAANESGTPYAVPSARVKLTVMYGALRITSKAHRLSISLLFFLIIFNLDLPNCILHSANITDFCFLAKPCHVPAEATKRCHFKVSNSLSVVV